MFVVSVRVQIMECSWSNGETMDFNSKLKAILIDDEGEKLFPYLDSKGNITIGIGRNLSGKGISQDESRSLFSDDCSYFISSLPRHLPFFDALSDNRKIVLLDMCFNLGINGLLEYTHMLDCLQSKDYENAALEILNSKAYRENPKRYQRLSDIMHTDEWPWE